jgi:siroheme synthase (precorrin-2 oxidase/ferrochelatase)
MGLNKEIKEKIDNFFNSKTSEELYELSLKYGFLENNIPQKNEIIQSIKQRIIDEHRKHKNLDWEEIAARKIYDSYVKK